METVTFEKKRLLAAFVALLAVFAFAAIIAGDVAATNDPDVETPEPEASAEDETTAVDPDVVSDEEMPVPYIPAPADGGDDTTLYVACCAAAAVIALLAIVIVMAERKQ